eukprot:1767799-Pyramimonas_sp.AAC.1
MKGKVPLGSMFRRSWETSWRSPLGAPAKVPSRRRRRAAEINLDMLMRTALFWSLEGDGRLPFEL